MCVRACVRVCVCMYIYIYIYITPVYIHTHFFFSSYPCELVKCRLVCVPSMLCVWCDWRGNGPLLHYDKVKLELITVFLLSLSLWAKWINMTWLKCSTLRLVKQWHTDADKGGISLSHTHTPVNALWMFGQLRFLKCIMFQKEIR